MIKRLDPTLYAMQLGIPEAVYGKCDYLAPKEVVAWMTAQGLNYPSWVGSNLSGTGYDDNGVSNKMFVYMVYNTHESDAIVFKINFPHIAVHQSKQYTYETTAGKQNK